MPTKKLRKRNYLLSPMLLISMGVLFSCGKNKYPGCEIVSPSDGQIFTAPETITVSVEMHDDGDALTSQYLFVIDQNGSNDTVVNVRQHDFLFKKYILTRSFTSKPASVYKVFAYAHGGHGNSKTDSILIKTN